MNKKVKEIWKDIWGYTGLYQISNLGRVFSLIRNRILKGGKAGAGYLKVTLCKSGIQTDKYIHRLVGIYFVPNPKNKPEINHIDEVKDNNPANNLEWVIHLENMRYGTRTEKYVKPVRQFAKTGKFVKLWKSAAEADKKGFSFGLISKCCLGKIKSHRNFNWEFAS